MFENLAVFKTAYAMAVHAGQQQAIVAQNVANADTPGYVARMLPSFQDIHDARSLGDTGQKATRVAHLHGSADAAPLTSTMADRDFASPDGNTVSIDREMLRGVDAKRQHDRAIAIYGSALQILRTSLGRQ